MNHSALQRFNTAIDTHTHAWGYPSAEHPWVNGPIIDLVDSFDVHTAYTDERRRDEVTAAFGSESST